MWRWDQAEPFGSNPANENPSGVGAFDLPLRLPGQYFDKETNLHYNYFRDYDGSIGRYSESDPIGLKGGLNTYAYAGGDPLRKIDPSGTAFTYNQQGNTVTINATITIYGPNASTSLAQTWQNGINAYWNSGGNSFMYGKCKIVFNVQVNADPSSNWWFTASPADNYVYVASPPHRSWMLGHAYGHWSAAASPWEAAHESGHIFKLPDDYNKWTGKPNPGHAGHMMAEFGGLVHQHEINDILKNLSCQCF